MYSKKKRKKKEAERIEIEQEDTHTRSKVIYRTISHRTIKMALSKDINRGESTAHGVRRQRCLKRFMQA